MDCRLFGVMPYMNQVLLLFGTLGMTFGEISIKLKQFLSDFFSKRLQNSDIFPQQGVKSNL